MALEVWLWIIAGVIISEIIFIVWHRHNCKNKNVNSYDWIFTKLISFFIGGFFIFIQAFIVLHGFDTQIENPVAHYEYLIYELIILGAITLLFLINKQIAKCLNK